ncbi:MAG: metallophosphoesterase [Planctomyces sp.]|nr:metallophosphoesterase [Planctomyces sp.]
MVQTTRRGMLQTFSAGLLLGGLATSPTPAHAKQGYVDAVLADGEPPLPREGSFTMVVLPDTQNYSQHHPETFLAQTRWIADHVESRRIVCALHLGDVTNTSAPVEWERARAAMRQLDGTVPYFMVPGNHDYSAGGRAVDRTTLFSEYFPKADFENLASFGGVYDKEPARMENSFHRFEVAGRKFLVLGLEFGPRKDVVRWANEVAAKHADHEIILITHAYMYFDDSRYDWKSRGGKQSWNPHAYALAKATGDDVMDGTELWDNLVSRHENFILTLNGHVLNDGLGKLVSQTPAGRDVHQVLVNYQMRPNGGDGWLRLLEFRPDGTVQTFDYSPVLKQRNESLQNQFAMALSPVKAS